LPGHPGTPSKTVRSIFAVSVQVVVWFLCQFLKRFSPKKLSLQKKGDLLLEEQRYGRLLFTNK
jgi:hypothetical protein